MPLKNYDMNYRDYVESLAKDGGRNEMILNSGPIHAAIVMSRMFKYARKEVKMICGGFSGAVSNDEDYLSELEGFFKRKGTLKVLAEVDLSRSPKSKIYKILRQYSSQVTLLSVAPNRFRNTETSQPVHFAIGDEKMIRVETGTKDYTASVNFNNTEQAATLSELFEGVWQTSLNNPITLA